MRWLRRKKFALAYTYTAWRRSQSSAWTLICARCVLRACVAAAASGVPLLFVRTSCYVYTGFSQGDELKFLGLANSIREECRSIDRGMIGLPELRSVFSCLQNFYVHVDAGVSQRCWNLSGLRLTASEGRC